MVSRESVECVICSDGDLDGGLPMLSLIVGRVSGRVPVIFVTPDTRQDVVIRAFRLGASDCVTMSDTCADDIVEAIQRLRAIGGRPAATGACPNDYFAEAGGLTESLLPPEQLVRKLDEMRAQARSDVGILALQIMDVGYFATKFGQGTVEELSREFARRLTLVLQGVGYFCRRPDATFVALLSPVSGSAAFEMAINRISNELSFPARLSDLDFRIESVIGACDSGIAEEALIAIERADRSLEKAMARGARYHIAGADIYGTSLQHSAVRSRKANRRLGQRTRVHKQGKLVLTHLNAMIDCVVLDVSSTGARLRINNSLVLPEEFELILPYETQRRRVNVRWRRHKELGVEFAEPPLR